MIEQEKGQMSMFDQDTWFGKTCREHSVPEEMETAESYPEKTSGSSSKKQRKSQTQMPLFLDLRKASGRMPDASWGTDGASLGAYMMPSSGECRSAESAYVCLLTSMENPQERFYLNCGESPLVQQVSRLPQILESDADSKYLLSAKACRGILNRAERRGKKLPEQLEAALQIQAGL